jgi:hypothetical protein
VAFVGGRPRVAFRTGIERFFEKKRRENTYSGIRDCGGFRPWHRDFDNDRAKVIIKKKEEPRDKKVFIHKDY